MTFWLICVNQYSAVITNDSLAECNRLCLSRKDTVEILHVAYDLVFTRLVLVYDHIMIVIILFQFCTLH